MKIVSQIHKPKDFSEGQWHEALVTLAKKGFSPTMADLVANAKSGKAEEIIALFPESGGCKIYTDLIAKWETLYQDAGLKVDFSGLIIPKRQEGFNRLIVVPNGMTPQGAYDLCQKKFKCWKYTSASLDDVIVHEDRTAKDGAYTIWVEDSQEPNEKLKNKSANTIKELGISTETLTERLLHGYVYYPETGKHLDVSNWTLCSGSRSSDGRVPRVSWFGFDGKMCVDCDDPSDARDFLRSRQVVS